MSNLSTEHLVKCIIEKDKYKHTQQYLKEVQLDNESAENFINEALYNIITTNNYLPSAKLYALRFFKDLFISAQFHLIDGLHQSIIKQIVKTSQYDKENPDKTKRGSLYFEQVQKRQKQPELQKVSFSYVLFSTQIIYVLGVWHAVDQTNQTSDYATIYEKLKKAKVPFPQHDKELKFFKPQEKDLFLKNYKEWLSKLPEIQQESEDADQKENTQQKSKKSIKSKHKITEPDEPKVQIPLLSKDQNKITQRSQIQTKRQDMQNSKLQKTSINQSELNRTKEINDLKEKQIRKMQQKIDVSQRKNKESNEKISQLQIALKIAQQSNQVYSKTQDEKLKVKLTALQSKYSNLENKCMIFQKEVSHLKLRLQQSQALRGKQAIDLQQQKNMLKKTETQKNQIQQKLKISLEDSKNQLKEAKQKIGRLEREIQQLNAIKRSYKTIIQESHPEEDQKEKSRNQKQQKDKMEQLQKLNQETVQIYTKQAIQLKSLISQLKSTNQELENLIKSKDKQIRSLNDKFSEKTDEIAQLQVNIQNMKTEAHRLENQSCPVKQKKLPDQSPNQVQITVTVKREDSFSLDLNNNKPELKTQTQQKRQNSMSEYLLTHSSTPKCLPEPLQKPLQQTLCENFVTPLIEKVKNKSLGKTQKSEEKLRQKKQRYSAGKTFHFTNYDQRSLQQAVQMNSNRYSQINMQMKKTQYNSYGNICKPYQRVDPYLKQDHQNSVCKKTSALYLERKPYFYDYETPKPNAIQTLIPFIDNYFSQKSNMSYQDLIVLKSLCLSPVTRQKQPIFVDSNIEVKLLPNSGSKEISVLQVTNTGYSLIKVKAVSCHDQFKIVGEKYRFIHSNSTVEYRIQTRNKDLNLRYPIVSLIVTQDQGHRAKNIAYNVPLPLTLVQFTEMKKQIPSFYELDGSKLKVLKSEPFSLNSRLESLKQAFPHLSFIETGKSTRMEFKQKELSWQGNLLHSFIENVDTYFKMIQNGSQVTLEFTVRDYDMVSENYAKAMIQTLMFLLQ